MRVETDLLISILKLTDEGSALIEDIKNDSRVSLEITENLLAKLQQDGCLTLEPDNIKVNSQDRLRLAQKALSAGADIETIAGSLVWQEFESIAATAMRLNGFVVFQNFRFKQLGRKWEIDVVACRRPLVACLDCKDWHRGVKASATKRIVEAQIQRTTALADVLPNISARLPCTSWGTAKFVPIIVVLMQGPHMQMDNVPIVPVLKLQDFVHQLPLELNSLKYFRKEFFHL